MADLSAAQLLELRQQLDLLVGVQFDVLNLPRAVLAGFEPSQIGTLVGVLMDACIPQLNHIVHDEAILDKIGLKKHAGILGEREGYPDFLHSSGVRLELKLLYVDPEGVEMKRPPTRREASARLTQKVTVKNVDPEHDALLVVAYQLQPNAPDAEFFSPTIIDLEVFSMIECIRARDHRLGLVGRWMGDYETPVILSALGKAKLALGKDLTLTTYGRKADEGHDFNEDTNFGKLKRIPYEPLQQFLKKHNASYTVAGTYPLPWAIGSDAAEILRQPLERLEQLEVESE
jgi:hypothetical protein